MSFNNRVDFVNAQASEKITLAHIHATSRIFNWTHVSGNKYSRVTDHFVVGLNNELVELTQVYNDSLLTSGTWSYDVASSIVYVDLNGVNPQTVEMIARYRFFFADAPCTVSWDLTDTGKHVYYDARIEAAPGYKHKIGTDQKLVSVVGQGDIKLENNDGGLDNIYDTLIFENQRVDIYSWARTLNFSLSKRIYRGRVSNKRYNTEQVTFTIKDGIYDLLQDIPLVAFDETDSVNESVRGNYKRWIYGRVDGLKLQSVSQIGDGYLITGTISGSNAGDWDPSTNVPTLSNSTGTLGGNFKSTSSASVDFGAGSISFSTGDYVYFDGTTWEKRTSGPSFTGIGTTFLADTSPGDTLLIDTQEFNASQVISDTEIIPSDSPEYSFSGLNITLKPEIPTVVKNREFFVAGHATATLTKTVSSIIQLNRIQVSDVDGLSAGDFVEFDTSERIEIKTIAPNNVLVLRKNIILPPTLGSDVIRQPVQDLFVKTESVNSDKFTISNSSTETTLTLDSDTEFEIASTESFEFDGTFTNGSRTITTTDNVNLNETLKPRDYIKPNNIAYTTFYEILAVEAQSVTLRTAFTEATITSDSNGKRPEYIGDDTIISGNILGRTVDNTPNGEWIKTGAKLIRDLLTQGNIPDVNETSFTTADTKNVELVSIAIPLTPSGANVSLKNIIDKIAKSTNQALTLDNNLDMQIRSMLPNIPSSPVEIRDEHVVDWSIQSVNGDLIRNSLIRYRHKDIDRYTQESGTLTKSHSSEFVEKYVGTNVSQELDVYLYNDRSANIMAHREIYLRSLARAELRVRTDLRLEGVEIGDVVIVDLERLYKRFGDKTTNKKACLVVGKSVTGQKMELFLTDLGNVLNRTNIITENTAVDYPTSTTDEKLTQGYITATSGIVNSEENTQNINLIT